MKIMFIAKISAIGLMILALFLPISQCSQAIEEGSKKEHAAIDQYIYKPTEPNSFNALLTWIAPILFAILSFWLSSKILLSILQLLTGIWAGFFLWAQLLFSTKVLIGGYIAGLAICIYLFVTAITFYMQIKARWKKSDLM